MPRNRDSHSVEGPDSPFRPLLDAEYEDSFPRGADGRKPNIRRLFCAILGSITTGCTAYGFSIFSAELMHNLRLSEGQLDTITSISFSAGLVSFLPGLFVDKFGTRVGMFVGGTGGAMLLVTYWAVAKGYLFHSTESVSSHASGIDMVSLATLSFVQFFLSSFITGSVFKTIMANCGTGSKGTAVGIGKAYLGIGAGTCAMLFESFRSPTSSDLDYLLLCALIYISVAAIPGLLLLPGKKDEVKMPSASHFGQYELTASGLCDLTTLLHFRLLYVSLFCLVVAIIGGSLWSLIFAGEEMTDSQALIFGSFIIISWLGPIFGLLFLPYRQESTDAVADGDNYSHNGTNRYGLQRESNMSEHVRLLDGPPSEDHDDQMHCDVADQTSEDGEPSYTLLEMLKTPAAWYLLWTMTILVGGGTVMTNNLGQMTESLRFHESTTPAAIALFSVAQSIGRVATGTISEMALVGNGCQAIGSSTNGGCMSIFRTDTGGVPRPVFLIVASLVGALAHGILAFGSTEASFVTGVVLSAISFGMCWPLIVLIVGEVFGTAHMAANYMFYDGISLAGGTLLLTKVIAQNVYERNIGQDDTESQQFYSSSNICYGIVCFQMTHMITALLSLTCAVTSILFLRSTRHVYDQCHSTIMHSESSSENGTV